MEEATGMDDRTGADENTVLVESSVLDDSGRLGEDAGPGEAAGADEIITSGERGLAGTEPARMPAGGDGLGGDGTMSAAGEADARPADAGDSDRFVARWQELQAGFVDDPRRAVQEADALIADMMERLARLLADERQQLESRAGAGDVSTEDLRQGLQRYRSLFQRLLAA